MSLASFFTIRIIDRYIFKELFVTLLMSLVAVNTILMMEKVLRLTSLLAGIGASMSDFLQIILLIQPQLLLLTLPMSFMIAGLFTYSRLTIDNETVILRTSGMSFTEIAKPVFHLGIICFLAGLWISFSLAPAASKAVRLKVADIISLKAPLAIKEGSFYTLFKGVVIFVREKPSENHLKDVFIYDKRDKTRPWSIFAKDGEIVFYKDLSIGFNLKKGEVFFAQDLALTKLTFDSYNMTIKFTPDINVKVSELTPFELLAQASTAPQNEKKPMYIEFHRRFTFPLMILVAGFLAPAFAFRAGKAGRLGGLSLGIVFFLAYYSILIYFENLAKSGRIPLAVGGWTAFVLAMAATAILFTRENKR